jgi:molecular chaperone DnaK
MFLEGADYPSIKSATEKVSEMSQKLGAAMYAANAATAAAEESAPKNEDGVEDAEIVE